MKWRQHHTNPTVYRNVNPTLLATMLLARSIISDLLQPQICEKLSRKPVHPCFWISGFWAISCWILPSNEILWRTKFTKSKMCNFSGSPGKLAILSIPRASRGQPPMSEEQLLRHILTLYPPEKPNYQKVMLFDCTLLAPCALCFKMMPWPVLKSTI